MKNLMYYFNQVFNKKNSSNEEVKRMAKYSSKIVVSKDTEKSFEETSKELLLKMRKQVDEHTDKITKKYKIKYKCNENYVFRFSIKFNETLIQDLSTIGLKLVTVIKYSKKIKGKDVEGYKYIFTYLK